MYLSSVILKIKVNGNIIIIIIIIIIQGDQKVSVHLMFAVQKTRKNILNSFSYHDNVVRIRDNRWH
jgi:hypothetical protein